MPGYRASLKSPTSDELLNTYLIRPLAWLLVRPLSYTPVRPEAIIALHVALALAAALFFAQGTPTANRYAGSLLLAKILFDAVDGQLARAKGLVTRLGRFLDSLADFYTNLLLFLAIGLSAMTATGRTTQLALWIACFWVMTLQCSYFNYYLVAYMQATGKNTASRTDEGMTREDLREPGPVRWLQKLYLWTYGWQDDLIARVDDWSGRRRLVGPARRIWFTDALAVRLSSFLGLGTLLTPLAALALADRLELYPVYIFGVGNLVLLVCVAYRVALGRRLSRTL